MDQYEVYFLKGEAVEKIKQSKHFSIWWKSSSQFVSEVVCRTVKEMLKKITNVLSENISRSSIFRTNQAISI